MQTHVAKWGASCAVRLPKMAVETLGLHEGQAVRLNIEGDKLVLQKAPPRYTLEELVSQMNKCNQPSLEIDDTQGEEIL